MHSRKFSRGLRRAQLLAALAISAAALGCGPSATQTTPKPLSATAEQCSLASAVPLQAALRVVSQRCTSCHAPEAPASDYDWTNREAVLLHRRNIASRVAHDTMPPRGAPRLSADERQILICFGR